MPPVSVPGPRAWGGAVGARSRRAGRRRRTQGSSTSRPLPPKRSSTRGRVGLVGCVGPSSPEGGASPNARFFHRPPEGGWLPNHGCCAGGPEGPPLPARPARAPRGAALPCLAFLPMTRGPWVGWQATGTVCSASRRMRGFWPSPVRFPEGFRPFDSDSVAPKGHRVGASRPLPKKLLAGDGWLSTPEGVVRQPCQPRQPEGRFGLPAAFNTPKSAVCCSLALRPEGCGAGRHCAGLPKEVPLVSGRVSRKRPGVDQTTASVPHRVL